MKRFIYRYIVPALILLATLVSITGCSGNLRGAQILSTEDIRDKDISTVEITYLNQDNPLNSPVASLKSDDEDQAAYMDEFKDMIKSSKGMSLKEEKMFCPLTDSSHEIKVTFDGGTQLDFYYCEENNWIIWSDLENKDGQKILKYHFLSPKEPLDEWFETIRPLATLSEK